MHWLRLALLFPLLVFSGLRGAQLSLQWQDNSNNEAGFEVHRSPANNTSFTLLTTTARNATTHTDTTVTAGVLYFYKVRAVNQTGTSAFTSEVSGTGKDAQTITFGALAAKTYGDSAFTLGGTASSGLAVSYASSNTAVATVSGNTVTIVGAGTTTITASQAGDAAYLAAANVPQTLTVNKATLTVTANAASRAYGAANPAFSASFTGFAYSENIVTSLVTGTPSFTTNATSTSSVGGSFSITPAVGTLSSTNYLFSFAAGPLTITRASLTVTADAATREFGAADPTFSATITGFANGETTGTAGVTGAPAFSTNATGASPPATYTLTPAVGTLSAANYSFDTMVAGNFVITLTGQTITFAVLPAKTYGDASFTLVGTSTSGLTVAFASSDPTVATVSGTTVTIVGAGSTTITASQAGNGSYMAAANVPRTLTVNKAGLTVTANAASRAYGAADPGFSAVITGFVNGETILTPGAVNGSAGFSTNATNTSAAGGSYMVTPTTGTLASANYSFSFVGAALTITKAPLTVTADAATRAYGAADPVFTASYTGLANGEIFATSGITGAPGFSTTAILTSAPAVYPITPSIGTLASGNYSFGTFVNGNLTVTKANQAITFGALANRTFGDAPFALTATASSGLAVSYASSATGVATVSGSTVTIVGPGTTTITASQAGDANYFAAADAPQSLTVNGTAPSITVQPTDLTVAPTGVAQFTVAIGGLPASTVQWEVSTNGGGSYSNVVNDANHSGATSTTLTVSNASLAFNGYKYRAVATNGIAPNATSTAATLTVDNNAPLFTTNPANQSVTVGANAMFTAVATGTPLPGLQWQVSTNGGTSWTNLTEAAPYSGTATGTLSITNTTLGLNSYQYRCVATNALGSVPSSAGVLAVNGTAPVITTQPASATVPDAAAASFTVAASGNPAPTFQWEASTDGGGTWSNVTNTGVFSGATTATLSLSSVNAALSGRRFRAIATNAVSTATSAAAILTVQSAFVAPVVTTQPSSQTADVGTTVSIAATVYGIPTPSFQWFKNGAAIAGANGTSLTFASVALTDAGTYSLQATNAAGSVTSSGAALTLNPPPVFIGQPSSTTVAVGSSVVFNAAATGSPTYRWQRDGVDIPGATGSSLTIASVQATDAGLYAAVATNAAGSVTSPGAVLGIIITQQVQGAATVVQQDIVHPNGNTFDQVLLTGTSAIVSAQPQQVTRISFIDLSDDIVQVELFGAGNLSLSLAGATGPALPLKYNQDVLYMKGHASLSISGADATTYVSVFSVGRANAVNQSLFRDGVTYDGVADIALLSISSRDGNFGSLLAGNASFFSTGGFTGIHAPSVRFGGAVYALDISAADGATPVFLIASAADTRITGGDLLQLNNRAVQVNGLTQLKFTAGTNSHGSLLPAQTNRGRLERNGVDVTSQVVLNPGP